MTKIKIRCNSPDDEWEQWYIDGEHVMTANHDDHGWDGMEAVRKVFQIFAEKLRVGIEYTNDDFED